LLTARVATRWVEGNAAGPSANSKGLIDDAGGFGVAVDTDLWLKVRIDGKEGWMHSEEDEREKAAMPVLRQFRSSPGPPHVLARPAG
jgi:hypothetical protein